MVPVCNSELVLCHCRLPRTPPRSERDRHPLLSSVEGTAMTAPTIRGQPASSRSTPAGQPVEAQAHRRAYQRRKARAKAKGEALRQKEAAQVERAP